MPKRPEGEIDEAIARLGRAEAVLRAQQALTPEERSRIPPHALLDVNDARGAHRSHSLETRTAVSSWHPGNRWVLVRC